MIAVDSDITELLGLASDGCGESQDRLLAMVYDELRSVARAKMIGVPPTETLQPTALVNEVYLRLFGRDLQPSWKNRRHFFWAVSRAMHDILVEKARHHAALKRGGNLVRRPFDENMVQVETQAFELLALSEAIKQLEVSSPRTAEVTRLRFFASLSNDDIVRVMGISNATVRREWAYAKAWLHQRLADNVKGSKASSRLRQFSKS